MTLDPEEIFAGLISFRKDIHAPATHIDYEARPFRFVLYSPNSNTFHFMPCQTVRGHIANMRRASSITAGMRVCGNCINAWNNKFPDRRLHAATFNLEQFFLQLDYDPAMWDGKASRMKLKPCAECLSEWNDGRGWKGYGNASEDDRKKFRDNFSIREFFTHCKSQEQFPRELTGLYGLMNTVWLGANIDNSYPGNWDGITDMYRIAQD